MENLSLVEEYSLFALAKNGKMKYMDLERVSAFYTAILIDLYLAKIIELKNNEIKIIGELKHEFVFFKPIYIYIKDNPNVKIKKYFKHFAWKISEKDHAKIWYKLTNSFEYKKWVKKYQKGVFVKSDVFISDSKIIKEMTNRIKQNLLVDSNFKERDIIMISLLKEGLIWKWFFSKEEVKDFRIKLKELEVNPKFEKIFKSNKEILSTISTASALAY